MPDAQSLKIVGVSPAATPTRFTVRRGFIVGAYCVPKMTFSSYRGYLYALIAFGTWGFLPIYWKQLQSLPALEILAHRFIWSAVTMLIFLAILRDGSWLRKLRRSPRALLFVFAASLLTAFNWITYIWAVNTGFVAKISLGYFINPLVSVLLGAMFLGERLRGGQIIAVLVAAAGVLYLTLNLGEIPWIALSLALTFGLYGLVRKKIDLSGPQGFCVETTIMLAPALCILLFLGQQGGAVMSGGGGWARVALLLGSGVVSSIPLVSFGAAARLIPLSSLGLMQYLAPSIQFLIGIFLYREPFATVQLVGYIFIWAALFLYSLEGILHARNAPRIGVAT